MARSGDSEGTSTATNDAYTGMLAISLLALIGGGVLLYLDYSRYPKKDPEIPRASSLLDQQPANPVS